VVPPLEAAFLALTGAGVDDVLASHGAAR
jgi:hypothetical protein